MPLGSDSHAVVRGSFMDAGDFGPYSQDSDDHFRRVSLAAQECPDGLVARNSALSAFLSPSINVDQLPVYAFFPFALRGGLRKVRTVGALKSGGRTFVLGRRSARTLGLPSAVF